MSRARRFQDPPAARSDADAAKKQRPRRAVVDNMRRKIERALAGADAAEELAQAAQAILIAAEAEHLLLDSADLMALRAALVKYREVHDG